MKCLAEVSPMIFVWLVVLIVVALDGIKEIVEAWKGKS